MIGGSGFIGYHVVTALNDRGYEVKIGTRSNVTNSTSIRFDIAKMTDKQLSEVLSGFTHIVFSAGADDRSTAKGDAWKYFYNENVVPCVRLATLCRELPVLKIVIIGSYFSYVDRVNPAWKLSSTHPYIASRKLQIDETCEAADGKTEIVVLQPPYIFGATPGKVPLWKELGLLDYVKWPIVFYPTGGTNIVSVEQVAKATIGAIESAKHKECWIVGDRNVTWVELINLLALGMGKPRGPTIITVPTVVVTLFMYLVQFMFTLFCVHLGLKAGAFMKVQTSCTFFPEDELTRSMQALGYEHADMEASIRDTCRGAETTGTTGVTPSA